MVSCKRDDSGPTTNAPSKLQYVPNSISTPVGVAKSSAKPSIEGLSPISFTLTTSPDAGSGVTINSLTGEIMVSSSAVMGLYKATVIATNTAGSVTFKDIFSINVGASTPITFNSDILPLITNNCTPCHVSGGSNTNFENYILAKDNINNILNRVNRTQGSVGFMPKGGNKLSAADIDLLKQWQTDGLKEN